MMASRRHGAIYTGVSSDLIYRVSQHRELLIDRWSKQHRCTRVVWYQAYDLMTDAIQREKSLKRWPRDWKCNLIERDNPHWDDLWPGLIGSPPLIPVSPGLVPGPS